MPLLLRLSADGEQRGAGELDSAFALIAKERVGALMVSSDSVVVEMAPRIAQLLLRNRLPSIFGFPVGVEAGGLLSYGPATSELHRRAVRGCYLLAAVVTPSRT
jgi:putative ABC transport system substrate-binding protein